MGCPSAPASCPLTAAGLVRRHRPSLSAKSRLESYFRTNSPIRMARRLDLLTSVTPCASVTDRIHSSSSNSSVFQEHQPWKRQPSRRFTVAHLIVGISRTLNSRLFCAAPAKAMITSRCSCRSHEGRGPELREIRPVVHSFSRARCRMAHVSFHGLWLWEHKLACNAVLRSAAA